jgi:biopolymer transport protein ExbD/biopolymer transport protein TolR
MASGGRKRTASGALQNGGDLAAKQRQAGLQRRRPAQFGRESTLMGINKRDEGKKVNSNINVTPMVDVMLVLLIIFMVITPMLNNKVNVDLPTVNAAIIMENANKEDAVTVAVTRDGRAYLGGDVVPNLDDLGPKIAPKLENKTDKTVYLRGDIRANYGKFMDTVDQIRAAGVSNLVLLTEKRDQEDTPAKK